MICVDLLREMLYLQKRYELNLLFHSELDIALSKTACESNKT